MKLTTHLHLVPRSKNEQSYTSTPTIRLHGMVHSYSTVTTWPFTFTFTTVTGRDVHGFFNLILVHTNARNWRPWSERLLIEQDLQFKFFMSIPPPPPPSSLNPGKHFSQNGKGAMAKSVTTGRDDKRTPISMRSTKCDPAIQAFDWPKSVRAVNARIFTLLKQCGIANTLKLVLNREVWGGRDMWHAWGRREVFTGFWSGGPKARNHWEDLGVGKRITLRWTSGR
jgi:hypothetical protein